MEIDAVSEFPQGLKPSSSLRIGHNIGMGKELLEALAQVLGQGSTKEGRQMVLSCYRRHSGGTLGCGHVGLVRICGVWHELRALWV